MDQTIKKSIHYPCPYGNDECPKCKPVNHEYSCRCSCHDMNQTKNRIREEFRKRFSYANFTWNGDHETGIEIAKKQRNEVEKFWLSKIAELLKSQKEEKVGETKRIWYQKGCEDTKKELVEKGNGLNKVFPHYKCKEGLALCDQCIAKTAYNKGIEDYQNLIKE